MLPIPVVQNNRVTTHGTGEATITVGYNGETATMKVVVYPKGGSITLDTVNYRDGPGQHL